MECTSGRPRSLGRAAAFALLVAALASCRKPQVAQGECRSVNGGNVCTWGEMSGSTLVAFGATIPMRSVDGAPAEAPMHWPPVADAVIPLPPSVRSASGFESLTMYWEPHGHPPGPYLTPHFDFHFNAVPTATLDAIDCRDSTKPSALPTAYELPDVAIPELGTLIGLCVPEMGMHSLPSSELRSTTLFEKTMVVGYYHAQPIFVEPMITRATLLARRSFTLDIPNVPNPPASMRFPTRFRADYDSSAQAYRFAFSGFTGAAAP